MTCGERFKRLKDTLGLNFEQMAEIFGVDDKQVVINWYHGKAEMHHEFKGTLLRLEAENLPALSPHLSKSTLDAFAKGWARGRRLA